MAVSGPALPPHLLAKRKRDGSHGSESSEKSRSSSPEDASKKRRVMGPAPPPAPLDERPPKDPSNESDSSSDSDDDDDGYGPSLPAAGKTGEAQEEAASAFDTDLKEPEAPEKTKRDDWMMKPPTQDDLKARMDPTKLRARGFNTGKSARGSGGGDGDNAKWFETPEQKRKRLEDEVLGVTSTASQAAPKDSRTKAQRAQDEEKARLIQKHNEQNRNKSLFDMRKSSKKADEDDDPSKRAFDYEKDMSAAPRVTGAQKRELMNRAADFGSRFSKGSYL